MFLFITQYFTGLKLHGARNQLIKAAVSALSKRGNLNRCRITYLTSSLQGMHGWYCKCIRKCKHQIQAVSSWWIIPCRSCQLAWAIGIRTWTVLNSTADLLSELGNHNRLPEDLLQDFFLVWIKCFQNTNPKLSVFLRFFFIFPICNNLFVHLSYIWPIV